MLLLNDGIAVEQYNTNKVLIIQTILLLCSKDNVFQCCAATSAATGDKNASRCSIEQI